jgi:quercetin dioxygenase-like cupin family protein
MSNAKRRTGAPEASAIANELRLEHVRLQVNLKMTGGLAAHGAVSSLPSAFLDLRPLRYARPKLTKTQGGRDMVDAALETKAPAPAGIVPTPLHEALHRGIADLPFVDLGDGTALQVLQVDLAQGLWITRVRFQPGTQIPTHYHTGHVFAVTEKGRWFYAEYPDTVNEAGSYLYEPAGSVHTLTVAEDAGETQVWFAIWGANVNVSPDGQVESILDAATVLNAYRGLCAAAGLDASGVIVQGE